MMTYPGIWNNPSEARRQAARDARLLEAVSGLTEVRFETAPYDARFPNQNQTKNCWQNYVDFHKCVKAKGEEFAPCQHFKYVYEVLCPPLWTAKWDELVAENRFPANLLPPRLD